ncbi:MAG: RND family transporter, partial [Candidatus Bipolaricaulia bacterium]
NVQRMLRGEQQSYRLWGIAIDVNLESEDEGETAGPFIMFTVIAVLVVVGISLRSYWAVALTGSGLGILMIWLKGISNLIGLKSGLIIDLIVPIAMISLGVDFAIHALRRYQEERRKEYVPRRAFLLGIAGVLGALTLAMMTDGVAFLSNLSSDIEGVFQFGIAAGIAVIASFIVLGVVVPLAMMRIDALREGAIAGHQKSGAMIVVRSINMAGVASLSAFGVIALVAINPLIGVGVIFLSVILGLGLPVMVTVRRNARRTILTPVTGQENPSPSQGAPAVKEPMSSGALASVIVKLANNRTLLLPVVAAITAAAIFYALKLEPTFDVKDFFDNQSDFVVSLDKVDEHVGEIGGEPGIIYIQGDLTDPAALETMQELLDTMERNPYLAKDTDGELNLQGTTVFALLRRLTESEYARSQVNRVTGVKIEDANHDGIPDTNEQINAAYDYMVQHGVPLDEDTLAYEAARARETLFHDPTGAEEDATTLVVGIPGTREQSVVTAARNALEENFQVLKEIPSISLVGLTGSPVIREATLNAVTRSLNIALPIAAFSCFLVIMMALRSVRFAVVTIIPIGLVVAWLYALMYLAGFALNFVTALIAAISIGIGVDYSIHMTERFREELARLGGRVQALCQAARGTGVALLSSGVSSIAGFAIMGFAPMPMFSAYGILTAIMIFLALAASLLVLPSLLFLVTPERTS